MIHTPSPGVLGICVIAKDLLAIRLVSVHNKGHVDTTMSAMKLAEGGRQ